MNTKNMKECYVSSNKKNNYKNALLRNIENERDCLTSHENNKNALFC